MKSDEIGEEMKQTDDPIPEAITKKES